uniref:Uncharacterized protein n=1 Tax=Gadus morhua TaxID=8049 RepID=A0A8C5FH99_GADMO
PNPISTPPPCIDGFAKLNLSTCVNTHVYTHPCAYTRAHTHTKKHTHLICSSDVNS